MIKTGYFIPAIEQENTGGSPAFYGVQSVDKKKKVCNNQKEGLGKLGNDKLITELHNKYSKKLINLSNGIVKDIELAEDVVQEVFVKFSRVLETFEKSCSYYTYLYRMTVNRSIDEYRKKKRISSKTTILYDNVSDKSKDLDLILSVRKIIGELDDIYRVPIILIDYDGLSYEEGANILNISLPAFRSRLIRGREILIKKIKLKEIY